MATIGCTINKATTPAAKLAQRIRGLRRVTVMYGTACARRNGRMVTIARGGHGDVVMRLREAIALLPKAERPEIHELNLACGESTLIRPDIILRMRQNRWHASIHALASVYFAAIADEYTELAREAVASPEELEALATAAAERGDRELYAFACDVFTASGYRRRAA